MYKTVLGATDGSVSTEWLLPVVKDVVEDSGGELSRMDAHG